MCVYVRARVPRTVVSVAVVVSVSVSVSITILHAHARARAHTHDLSLTTPNGAFAAQILVRWEQHKEEGDMGDKQQAQILKSALLSDFV